jgi:hypothetical protein
MHLEDTDSKLHPADSISIRQGYSILTKWIRYLFGHWMIICCFGISGAILGFIYSKMSKTRYLASTTFVLDEEKGGSSGFGSLAGIASIAGIDMNSGGGIFQGDNILELYKSRSMIQKTLLSEVKSTGQKELLVDRYIKFKELRVRWVEHPELSAIDFKLMRNQASSRLKDSILGGIVKDISQNYLKVSRPDKKLSIINVEMTAEDEFFSREFNIMIVKNVNDFYVQTKTKKSLQNVLILQQKVDSVRASMGGSIDYAAKVSDATPNLNPTRQAQRIAPMQRSQFSAETNRAILTELVKNLELSKIALRKETPLIQVVDQPIYPLDLKRFGKAKGIVLGGILGGFIIVFVLLLKKIFSV